ncbi:MAG: HNH endonuclease [Clostridia bacterium]|nr:HNH endonuclease [Clostridia bacterium]
MVNINDYREEKSCVYNDEEYLVRDNGAVLRKSRLNQKARKLDNEWTFGKLNSKTGYLEIASIRVHRIVAWAFHGEPPTMDHIVDHIDTNRQNNRPSNLRWTTRFENAVSNPITRKKIEYLTGVSIFEFLEDPSKYREDLKNSNYDWMRTVTEDESKAALQNLKNWLENEKKQSNGNGKIGDWIYNVRDPDVKSRWIEESSNTQERFYEQVNITDSLTPMAKQKNWQTPSKFVCCPNIVEGNPIECYLKRLSENIEFSVNQYGSSTIVKYFPVENRAIVVITINAKDVKPFALAKITYENGYYLHSSLGKFFTENGVEKQFTLERGLEWTGGDSIDDYC